MIQRLLGKTVNSEIWADTAWPSLEGAIREYPGETYREVSIISTISNHKQPKNASGIIVEIIKAEESGAWE